MVERAREKKERKAEKKNSWKLITGRFEAASAAPEFKSATEGIVASKSLAARRSALTLFSRKPDYARVYIGWVTSGARRPTGGRDNNPSSPSSFAVWSVSFSSVSFPLLAAAKCGSDHRRSPRKFSPKAGPARLVRYGERCGGICCESWPAQISIRAINYAAAQDAPTNASASAPRALSVVPVS